MRSRSLALGLAFLVLAGSGCELAGDDPGPTRALVGQAGMDLFVAMVADDRDVVVYACDGTATQVAVTEWFQGTHDGGEFELTSTRTDARVEGEFILSMGNGTLHLDGTERPFSLREVEGDAGLYFDEVEDDDAVEHWGGWIVSQDGDIRGSVLNRQTGGIVAAGDATPGASVTVGSLTFQVLRLEAPAL